MTIAQGAQEFALDRQVRSRDHEGHLRQQGTSGEDAELASRLVRSQLAILVSDLLIDQNSDKSRHANFKKGGKDGLGLHRCLLVSGPPGVGKTTAAHLVAKLEDYSVLELNASDTRGKKLLDVRLVTLTDQM